MPFFFQTWILLLSHLYFESKQEIVLIRRGDVGPISHFLRFAF